MRRSIEDGLSLITGMGIGMAAMYLLDPEAGHKRRRAVGEAMRGTGEALTHAWDGVWDNAQDAGEHAAEYARSAGSGMSSRTSSMYDSGKKALFGTSGLAASLGFRRKGAIEKFGDNISDTGHRWYDRASHFGHSLADRVRGYTPRGHARDYIDRGKSWFRSEPETQTSDIVSQTACVLGALALGAGLMLLFDPNAGRARRAWIRDKAMRYSNDTGEYMRRTGRHLRNKAQGVAAEARNMVQSDHATDNQIRERIRAHLGRIVSTPGTIEVAVHDGHVCLTGTLPPSEHDALVNGVLSVRGVKDVENQLRAPAPGSNMPSMQGARMGEGLH
jgi:hypothetical protein